jgi:hypothetical protein
MRLFRQKRLRRLFWRHLSRLDATSWASRDVCFGWKAVARLIQVGAIPVELSGSPG